MQHQKAVTLSSPQWMGRGLLSTFSAFHFYFMCITTDKRRSLLDPRGNILGWFLEHARPALPTFSLFCSDYNSHHLQTWLGVFQESCKVWVRLWIPTSRGRPRCTVPSDSSSRSGSGCPEKKEHVGWEGLGWQNLDASTQSHNNIIIMGC